MAELAAYAADRSWQLSGLCRQVDPEMWFPDKGEPSAPAKRLCVGCPVQARCLEFALDNGERYGVWGGLSERERRQLKAGQSAPLPRPRLVSEPLPMMACGCGLSGCPGLVSRATKYRHAGMAARGEQLMFRGAA